ncbi:uncharacterized protein LOC144122448 [Amblyomma americanum]
MNRMAAVVPAILRARNSSQARDPTHRPPFAALTSVLCCQRPASIGPCVLPAFGCVIPPDPFMLKTKSHMEVACDFCQGPGAGWEISGWSVVFTHQDKNHFSWLMGDVSRNLRPGQHWTACISKLKKKHETVNKY